MWGAAPHPAKGFALGSRYTTLLRFRKSTGFCVEQQERIGCSIPQKHFRQPVNKYRESGVQGNHSPASGFGGKEPPRLSLPTSSLRFSRLEPKAFALPFIPVQR